jgi:enoyl-CoA hydratase/carnithine racemase
MNVHARPDNATILLREDRDGIALLTLNNPAARNALSEELIGALSGAFDAIGRDAAARPSVPATT